MAYFAADVLLICELCSLALCCVGVIRYSTIAGGRSNFASGSTFPTAVVTETDGGDVELQGDIASEDGPAT